jgi:hypothetical protein
MLPNPALAHWATIISLLTELSDIVVARSNSKYVYLITRRRPPRRTLEFENARYPGFRPPRRTASRAASMPCLRH